MNRILQSYLNRIHRAAERIEAAAAVTREEVAALQAEREELTMKYWSRGKKAGVMAENHEAFAALQAENARLREKLEQARVHAGRLRSLARALKEGVEGGA